jgi:hypothetical protein
MIFNEVLFVRLSLLAATDSTMMPTNADQDKQSTYVQSDQDLLSAVRT